ncbi:UNVERIFIED_ORG: hypothetical protein L601_000800000460 [Gordonia westfalica J30]
MNTAAFIEFQRQLDTMPTLPADARGEFEHFVSSGWIDGIEHNDRESSDTVVRLSRYANSEEGYAVNLLEYVVEFHFSQADAVRMAPAAAIKLGQLLMLAGAHAIGDLAHHADFLTAEVTE